MAAQDEMPLDTGITGSTPSNPRRNPTEILSSPEVQRLMLAIAERPHTRAEVEAAIAGRFFDVDDMVAVGLLREEKGRLWIDFNLLRVDDQKRILAATESIGSKAVEAPQRRRHPDKLFIAILWRLSHRSVAHRSDRRTTRTETFVS